MDMQTYTYTHDTDTRTDIGMNTVSDFHLANYVATQIGKINIIKSK